MFFTISLYLSLAIFALGVLYKTSRWFKLGLTTTDRRIGVVPRLSGILRSIVVVLFGREALKLARSFLLDVLLLRRTYTRDLFRWTMHMLIFWGFMLLLLMHALEIHVSRRLFSDYMSTLNPYLFLREFFGIMVLAGIGMALYRRFKMPKPRLKTKSMDVITIVVLAVILISGFLLKGSKIASRSEFLRMVEDYSFIYEEEELRSLESLWVQDYGLISPAVKKPFDGAVLATGRELNDMFCVHCHSSSQWAFVSYGTSQLTRPVTSYSDGKAMVSMFWYIHILACFIGLAWLPFGKMFHVLTSPLSLLSASVAGRESDPAVTATRRAMELDACTHCGACSERCSVGIATESIANPLILPSEKLHALTAVATGKDLPPKERRALVEGLVVCTNCHRCTDVCPVGINLQDIWTAVREDLLRHGPAEPYTLSQLGLHEVLQTDTKDLEQVRTPSMAALKLLQDRFVKAEHGNLHAPAKYEHDHGRAIFSDQNSFTACFNCRTCTSSCPVLDHFENPGKELDLLPHQIIHATAMGFGDLAASSRMLWACLGCYQCQEQCPQGVRVADVFFAHKQTALARLKTGDQ